MGNKLGGVEDDVLREGRSGEAVEEAEEELELPPPMKPLTVPTEEPSLRDSKVNSFDPHMIAVQ